MFPVSLCLSMILIYSATSPGLNMSYQEIITLSCLLKVPRSLPPSLTVFELFFLFSSHVRSMVSPAMSAKWSCLVFELS